MKTYGVVDIGSNTIRLVLYKMESTGLVSLLNKKKAVGLAGYITQSGKMSKAGIEKAAQVLLEFKEIVENIDVQAVYVFATASLRNVANTEEAVDMLQRKTGFPIRVLSGKEEATYDFYGAMHALPISDGLLVDIGGGSTEFVLFKEKQIMSAQSIKIGSLNLFTQYVKEIVPSSKATKAIAKRAQEELEQSVLQEREATPHAICAVGGTARAALELMQASDPEAVQEDGSYSVRAFKKLVGRFEEDKKGFLRLVLRCAPDRVHTIVPGLILLMHIAEYCRAKKIYTSAFGVREGYLSASLQQEEGQQDESHN